MKYWNEMLDKYGFDDGAAEPSDAAYCRDVYIRVVNHFAAKRGSMVRAKAYDRPGLHNPCMVAFVRATDEKILGDPDAPMLAAIEDAEDFGCDDYVVTTIEIDEESLEQDLCWIGITERSEHELESADQDQW